MFVNLLLKMVVLVANFMMSLSLLSDDSRIQDLVKQSALHRTDLDRFAIAIDVMRLIDALHSVGVIHGDVKPDNFMVVSER